jgi:hypothetical protein
MAGLMEVINRHDERLYYVSVIERRKTLTIHRRYDFLNLDVTFNFRYEAAVWDKHPFPLLSKPLLLVNLDDGTLAPSNTKEDFGPSITKDEFSTLVELVLRDEPIERLFGDDKTDIFEKFDVLSTQNVVGGFFFLWKVRQVALMIRPDHGRNVRALLTAAQNADAARSTGSRQEAKVLSA